MTKHLICSPLDGTQVSSWDFHEKPGSTLKRKDDEDLEYLMDDMGNIESSQRREGSQAPSAEQLPDWELWPDDEAHLEALEEMERTSAEEVPDELLLESMAQFESSEYAG